MKVFLYLVCYSYFRLLLTKENMAQQIILTSGKFLGQIFYLVDAAILLCLYFPWIVFFKVNKWSKVNEFVTWLSMKQPFFLYSLQYLMIMYLFN